MQPLWIANGAGFWGDWLEAPRRTVEAAPVDYLMLEYLAELTLSILAHQRARDPQAGYVTDFPFVLESLLSALSAQPGLKIITNAGGMNPPSCAREVSWILKAGQLPGVRVGVVTGDDLLPRWEELQSLGEGFDHLETGEPLADRCEKLVSVNAYLGAAGLVAALAEEARIVICGRCADASLTVGPAVREFGWSWTDWDSLAVATVAGHLIECGAQATGGMDSQWSADRPLANVGYPIAELTADGQLTVTKPEGTDGQVSVGTLSEQLIYEIGDPAHYLTPDVDADFSQVRLIETEPNRVQVAGAKGRTAPERFKVSLAYRDGYAVSTMLVICGTNAEAKARACGELILQRLNLAGQSPARANVEILGAGDSLPGIWRRASSIDPQNVLPPGEVVLRLTARDPSKEKLERLVREVAPLVTSGPPGVTGYTGPRPKPYPVLAYWPTSIARELVRPQVEVKTALEWST